MLVKHIKGYTALPVMETHGLLASEMLFKLVRCTSCEISFKSLILLFANVNVVKLVGKKRSH